MRLRRFIISNNKQFSFKSQQTICLRTLAHLGKAWLAKAREWRKSAKLSGTISYHDDGDEDDEIMIMTMMMIMTMTMIMTMMMMMATRMMSGDKDDDMMIVTMMMMLENFVKLSGTIFFRLTT